MLKKLAILATCLTCLNATASIKIDEITKANDLAGFNVTNTTNNQKFDVYYAPELKSAAFQALSVLDKMYTELAVNAGAVPKDVKWAELAFVTDENYIPPRSEGVVRWKIVHPVQENLSDIAIERIHLLISHEQTHSIQSRIVCDSPRWFEEGQAMWNELKVAEKWNSDLAHAERLSYEQKFREIEGDLNLDNWGGIKVKPEAIQRQLTPEQKQKMEEDPSYFPSGPFSFGPGDFISDESNTEARYFVSLTIFELLEKRLGSDKLKSLFNDVYQMSSCESEELKEFIKSKYGVDISSFFHH